MSQTIIVPCPVCQDDKGFAYQIDINRRDGSLIEGWQHCFACEATGEVEEDTQPIDFENILDVLLPRPEDVDIIMTELVATGQRAYFLSVDGKLFILSDDGELEPVQ